MSLFDKIKNIFTDDVEEEVKTGMIKVEIPSPAKPENVKTNDDPNDNNIADNKIIKNDEKPLAPIFFDDDYFKELEQPKPEIKSSYKKDKSSVNIQKQFKVSPIISPVYGVLDKNYSKDEITTKTPIRDYTSVNLTIDDIRQKAYGTLEDDLENTLFGERSILFNDELDKPVETDLFEEMTKEETIDLDLNDKQEDNLVSNENDLFDLIDSIYSEVDKND